MASQSRKIPIKKIVTDQRYYPRIKVDQERVKEFVELMECGTYFPPIKVVRDPKTGLLILLDGKHRLEACILRGEVEISADVFYLPEKHWLMASARFNSKSSKPLTGDETKKIITITWYSGIKDTEVIAHEMGCTPRYVEMVLKPVRDEDRNKRNEKILELHRQGKSQRKISSEVGLSLCCVNMTIRSNNESNENFLEQVENEVIEAPDQNTEVFYKRSNFVYRTPSEDNNNNDLKSSPENRGSKSVATPFQNEMGIAPDREPHDETSHQSETILSGTPAEPDDSQVFYKRSNFVYRTPHDKNNISKLEDSQKKSDQNFQSEVQSNSLDSEPETPPTQSPDQKFPKRSNFVLDTRNEENNISELQSSSEKSIQNFQSENPDKSPEIEPETPDEGNNISELETASQKPASDSAKVAPEISIPDVIPTGNDRQSKETPYPSYMDQIHFYNELPAKGQHAIRAMELAKQYKVNILDIAKEIGEPPLWTKKVLVSAIALSLMNGERLSDISSVETMIGIDFNTAEAIQALLPFQSMLCPVAPEMEQWMKDNLSSQDLDMILELVDVKENDLPYLLKGETPPALKKNRFEELPASYKEQLQAYIALLRELRDHAKNKRFNQDSAKQLLVHLNKNVTVINEIVQGLREDKLL